MAKKGDIISELEKSEEELIGKIDKSIGVFLIAAGTIILIVFAWFLIIVGIVGLILPIIPGIALIILGIYILRSNRVRIYSAKIMRMFRKKS